MLKGIIDGVLAGIMISIGGTVLISCDNSFVGAIFFSVALLAICFRGYSLYTGKIGFIASSHTKKDFMVLFTGLFGNLIGTLIGGLAINTCLNKVAVNAERMCQAKLDADLFGVFIKAIFCGILMYIAVAVYKEQKSISAIFFCVPVFILSGFEHSIADMYYFFVSKTFSLEMVLFLLIVVLGNTVGGLLFPMLGKIGVKKNTEEAK